MSKNFLSFVCGAFVALLLFAGCKGSDAEPRPETPMTTKPAKTKQKIRTVIEVWCDKPIQLSFWGVNWRGILSHEDKTYGRKGEIYLLEDLGKLRMQGTYYKTEFQATEGHFLVVNMWVTLPDMRIGDDLTVKVRSRSYVNGEHHKDSDFDKIDDRIGIFGRNFTLGKSPQIKPTPSGS